MADNYKNTNAFPIGENHNVTLRSTEGVGGEHTPHVILEGIDDLTIDNIENVNIENVEATLVGDEQTPSWATYATNHTIAAGATSITITTSSDWTGTVAGTAFPISTTLTWVAAPGHTLAALAIVRVAGTVSVAKVV